jgi:hypothetical protein
VKETRSSGCFSPTNRVASVGDPDNHRIRNVVVPCSGRVLKGNLKSIFRSWLNRWVFRFERGMNLLLNNLLVVVHENQFHIDEADWLARNIPKCSLHGIDSMAQIVRAGHNVKVAHVDPLLDFRGFLHLS